MIEAKFPPIQGYEPVRFHGYGCGGRAICASLFVARKLESNVLVFMTVSNQRGPDRFPGRVGPAIQALEHPNILRVIDVGEVEGCYYEAIEYVEAQTLSERINQGVIPVTQALAVGSSLASALLYLRDQDVNVRSLSPQAILLTEESDAKLHPADLVKSADGTQHQDFLAGLMSAPAFCPPECLSGECVGITPAGDVYRLGAVMYAMLTGQSPFIGDKLVMVVDQVISAPPVPLRFLNPAVPKDLETICARCLEKLPQRRYESARHLLEAIIGTGWTFESKAAT